MFVTCGSVVASRAVAGWLIASIGTVPGNSWTDCETTKPA